MTDDVNKPAHYNTHPSGVECIQISEHHDFCVGNVIKYCWRAGLKGSESELKDLRKAQWYLNRKVAQLEKAEGKANSSTPSGFEDLGNGYGKPE